MSEFIGEGQDNQKHQASLVEYGPEHSRSTLQNHWTDRALSFQSGGTGGEVNRLQHGISSWRLREDKAVRITELEWESGGKWLYPKLKFPQFENSKFKMPSLKDLQGAWLEDTQ